MPEFEAATGYVQLIPSARNFAKEAEAELAPIDLDKDVELDADATRLNARIAEAEERLASLQRSKTNPKLDADITALTGKVARAHKNLQALQDRRTNPPADLDDLALQAKIRAAHDRLQRLGAKKVTAQTDADIAVTTAKLSRLEKQLDALRVARRVRLDADIAAAQANIRRLEGELAALQRRKTSTVVDAKIEAAQAKLAELNRQRDALIAARANISVDAPNAANTTNQLQQTGRAAQSLAGRRVNIPISAPRLPDLTRNLYAVVAALAAIAAAAGPAVAALAALPSAVAGLGQMVGALAGGFSGVKDAISAVTSEAEKSGSAGASAANKQASAQRAIADAARGVETAQIQQARTAIQGAQQVAAAQRAVEQAIIQQQRTAIQGAQAVAAAQRQLAQTIVQAQRSVEDAQRSYTRALQQERYAQESLNDARREAVRTLEDLKLATSGAALSQERAQLNLERARQRLAAADASGMPQGLERQELDLDVREAQQSLAEVSNRYKNLREDSAEWSRTGVEGSKGVVSAMRALQAAQQSTQDSARQLSRAQVDGANAVREAQINLAQTTQQAMWANQDAARAVADAQIALQQAQQQAMWANQDAARAVADAQRALADAYRQAGEAGAAGANKAATALSKLSPAGREFVRFWIDEVRPKIKEITDSIAEAMLPKIQTAIRNLFPLVGTFKDGLTETGNVIGDLAIKGSEMMASGPWRDDFRTIMAGNNVALRNFGGAGLQLADALRSITVAGQPLLIRLSELALRGSEMFNAWIQGMRNTGELQRTLTGWGDKLITLGQHTGTAAGKVPGLVAALAPLGEKLIEMLPSIIEVATALANGLVRGLETLEPLLKLVFGAITKLAEAFNDLPPGVQGAIAAFILLPRVLGTVIGIFTRLGGAVRGAVMVITGLLTGNLGRVLSGLPGMAGRAGAGFAGGLASGMTSGAAGFVGAAGGVGSRGAAAARGGWLAGFARTAGAAGLVLLAVDIIDQLTGRSIASNTGPGDGGIFDQFFNNINLWMGIINRYFTGEPLAPAQAAWLKAWEDFAQGMSPEKLRMRENMDRVREAVRTGLIPIPPEVQAQGQQAVERFIGALAALPEQARGTVAGVQQALRTAIQPSLSDMGIYGKQAADNLVGNIQATIQGRSEDLRMTGDGITAALTRGLNNLPPAGQRAGAQTTQQLTAQLNQAAPQANGAAQNTAAGWVNGAAGLPGQAAGVGGQTTSGFMGGVNPLPGQAGANAGQTATQFNGGVARMPGDAGNIGAGITGEFLGGGALGALPGGAADVSRRTAGSVGTELTRAERPAGDAGHAAGRSFHDRFQSWVQTIGDMVGRFVQSMSQQLASIGSGGGAPGGRFGAMAYAQGGLVQGYAQGGHVGPASGVQHFATGRGSRTPQVGDDVAARLKVGEYVSNTRTVGLLSPEFFATLARLSSRQADVVRAATAQALSAGGPRVEGMVGGRMAAAPSTRVVMRTPAATGGADTRPNVTVVQNFGADASPTAALEAANYVMGRRRG